MANTAPNPELPFTLEENLLTPKLRILKVDVVVKILLEP
jgi:hypothetical protein